MTFYLIAATAYLTCGALMLFLGFVVLRENPRQLLNRATAAMLVFGGLGLFVAKVFLIGLVLALAVAVVGGLGIGRGTA